MAVTNPTLIQMGALGRQTPMSVGSVEYLHGFADGELGVVESIGETSQMAGRQPTVGQLPGGWYPGKYVGEAFTGVQGASNVAVMAGLGVLALVGLFIGYKVLTK